MHGHPFDPIARPPFRTRLAVAVLLLLVAFAFRVYAIAEVPPGLTHDEVSELDVAAQVRHGDWQLLYARGYGVEPAYYPLLSAAQSIWGENPLSRRLPTIFAGVIGLACTYVLAHRLFGWRVGLIALGVASVVWWSIIMARAIEREMLEVPLYALALYGFWRGFESASRAGQPPRLWPFVAGGVALGAAQYVHTIPRGLFLVLILFGLYLFVLHRPLFQRTWRGILVFVLVAEGIAAPILIAAAQQPQIDRLPIDLYSAPDAGAALVEQLRLSVPFILGQFAFTGDDWWNFNIPYRPIFEPLGAALLGLGLLVALRRIHHPASAFALIALAVSLLPSIFLDPHFPFARMISAQAIVFAILGLGAERVSESLGRPMSGRARAVWTTALLGGLLAVNAVWTARDLFVTWPESPGARSTYNAGLRELSRYLDTLPQAPAISQCTLWIVYPWDPQYHRSVAQSTMPYMLRRRDLDVRWHDCRYSLVIPASGQFLYTHPDLQPLSDFLGRSLRKPWLESAQPVPGLSGALQVDVRLALAQKLAEWSQLPVHWPPEATVTPPARLPVDFDRAAELIGYRIAPTSLRPGDSLRVVTYWRAAGALPEDVLIFTHLYRTPTDVMAQQDQLDVATPYLRPGDIFAQVHEFITVPPGTPPGLYWIGVGLYRRGSGERLPIFAGDRRVADRVLLTQIQVEP